MRKLKFTYFILTLIISISCKRENQENKKANIDEDNYKISASLTGFPDGTKFYLKNLATDSNIDSASIKNGNFVLSGHLNNPPEQLWLTANIDDEFKYTNLLIGNDSIHITGDREDFPWDVQTSGSKIQSEYYKARGLTRKFDKERDSLVNYFMKLESEDQQKEGKRIWGRISEIDSITLNNRIKYIKNNNTYISIIDLGYLRKKMDKDSIKSVFDNYSNEIQESKYGNVIRVYLNSKTREIGDSIYDFKGINQANRTTSLSQNQDSSKYILIDFTSTYCGACIKAADELSKVHNSFKDSLNIVSFSGDSKKENWLKGIERDSISWQSIWDGKGRYSETAITYGVNAFPTFVLINPEGLIVDKWIGYSEGSLIEHIKQNIDM